MKSNDAANPGIIRPPLVHLLSILVGLALNLQWPLRFSFGHITQLLSVVLFAAGVLLFVLARNEFRSVATPVAGHQPTTQIVKSGIFRFSRNPIYLSFSMLHLAVLFWIQSGWLLLTLVFPWIVIDRFVIPREEAYLEKKFGVKYLEYKSTVRRWI